MASDDKKRSYEKVPGHWPEPGQIIHLVNSVPDINNLGETLKKKHLSDDEYINLNIKSSIKITNAHIKIQNNVTKSCIFSQSNGIMKKNR